MIREKAVIGLIGVERREINVIRSIFRLATWLQDTFYLPNENENREPDVLIVNADSQLALQKWWRQRKIHERVISVLVTSKSINFKNTIVLKRPLIVKRILDVFKTISSTELLPIEPVYGSDQLNILVVDDSLPVRKYMEYKLPELAQCNIHLDFAATGEEAKEKTFNNNYDLIFLDVVLPGVDGYNVCKWIKANAPTKVVLLTSRKSPFDKVRGALSGCDSYLPKPPADHNLKKIIDQCSKSIWKQQRSLFGLSNEGY